MKHAFLITAYKDAEQLSLLIQVLCTYNSEIYIHIDKRSEKLTNEIKQKYSGFKNIHILKKAINVYFAGFSHLRAILMLIEEAFKNPEIVYFHLISGQDLPLLSPEKFELFFNKNKEQNFISFFPLPNPGWTKGGKDRMELFHLNDLLDPKKKIIQQNKPQIFKSSK